MESTSRSSPLSVGSSASIESERSLTPVKFEKPVKFPLTKEHCDKILDAIRATGKRPTSKYTFKAVINPLNNSQVIIQMKDTATQKTIEMKVAQIVLTMNLDLKFRV